MSEAAEFSAYIPLASAAVAVVGTAVGFLYRERVMDRRRRASRTRDVQTALRAEINHYVEALQTDQLDEVWAEITQKIRNEGKDKYIPFVPEERNDIVFKSMLADISILPSRVVAPVVDYYNQVFAVSAIISDLRSDRYPTLSQTQRIFIYEDYIALKKRTLEKGIQALSALDSSLNQDRSRRSGAANNPDAARYDQQVG